MSKPAEITVDTGAHAGSGEPKRTLYWRFNRFLERHLPAGLYRRSLIIVIAPMVLLQTIMVAIFMERHWDQVTRTLSRSLAREIAAVINIYDNSAKTPESIVELEELANKRLSLGLKIQTGTTLPPPAQKPWFSLLDLKLSQYIAREVERPFWLDTIGQTGYVDIRIQPEKDVVFRFLTDHDRAAASSTYIFISWMLGSSLVLLIVAIVFLRNQIRPILQLAEAAQSFGMGREAPNFAPRGASEVRAAALAFIDMKRRIERHVEQRTAMLAGVSHDIRTILTRFKLELALIGDDERVEALKEDVDEMQRMLEGYINFVRGDAGEATAETDIAALLNSVAVVYSRRGPKFDVAADSSIRASVKPQAFKRVIANLAANAARHASLVIMNATLERGYLFVTVEDDGPGIPEDAREEVFRPFFRLDDARNLDSAGTGLGLAIARDIVHGHGGDITLGKSSLGGLKAEVHVPV